jgi:hypothetical protein
MIKRFRPSDQGTKPLETKPLRDPVKVPVGSLSPNLPANEDDPPSGLSKVANKVGTASSQASEKVRSTYNRVTGKGNQPTPQQVDARIREQASNRRERQLDELQSGDEDRATRRNVRGLRDQD